jgi:hypothetical protein
MSLEGQSETLKDQDQVQLATCSFEISKDKELGKQEHEARNTLDSDETLPNIELDTVIDNNNLNEPNQNLSEDTHINEQDINENQLFEQEDDDFGSFDQVDDDFDEDQPVNHVFEYTETRVYSSFFFYIIANPCI